MMPSYRAWSDKKVGLSGWLLRTFGLLLMLVTAPVVADNVVVGLPLGHTPNREAPQAPRLIPAKEHIIAFDVKARFNLDGSMEVRENIKVLSLQQEIRRGIFRTLPLSWDRQDGKIFSVDYQITSVSRDGATEPYSLEKSGKILTVRIGNPEYLLEPGIYNYEIRYQVSNHFSRFPDWDELYWNVTGNDWAYPIGKASFHLELPEASNHLDSNGKDDRLRSIDVYTGTRGEKGHNALILLDGSVQTTQPLARGEGLTVAYTWPRAILANAPAPEAVSPLLHLLLPTLKTSVIWIPVLLLIGYFLLWWRKNVTATQLKMPPVVPLYSPPSTMSPGYLRFLTQRNYDDVAFSSDLLDLVAKRGVALTRKAGKSQNASVFKRHATDEQWLSRQSDDKINRLSATDKQLIKTLFSNKRKNINLSLAYQRPMQNARKWLETRCEDQREQLFNHWSKAVRRGIGILLLVPLICGLLFNPWVALITLPALLLLLVAITMAALLLRFLFNPRKIWNSHGGIRLLTALIFSPLAIFSSDLLLFATQPLNQIPAGYIGALLVAIISCVIFAFRVPRFTQRGLNELATAKGLEMYLGAAEKHRFQVLYPPEQLVSHFERLLPFALALGVGKTWANTFAHYLISAGAMSEVFADANWQNVDNFSQSCGSSSSPTPSSSSSSSGSSGSSSSGSGSSGGGSSGGGSGGGGGGGW